MKRIGTCLMVITMFSLLLVAEVSSAQRGMHWRGSGGWGPGSQYGRMYDPTTVETIRGEVVSVERTPPMKGMSPGVHMTVKTATETVAIHMGPSWYLENQDVKVEPKDTVEVKGSRVTFRGKPAIIAAEVKKGEEVLTLRDDKGYPVWAGWRR
jgi:hypothetical protein